MNNPTYDSFRRFLADDAADFPEHDGLGFPIYPAMPMLDERSINVLRALGRLEIMDVSSIYHLVYAGRFGRSIAYRDLELLYNNDLVWRTLAPTSARSKQKLAKSASGERGGRRRYVYGLSNQGKTLLQTLGAEATEDAYDRLVSRALKGRYPSPSTIGHDLQVTWWCASLIEGLRRLPWCHSVFVQVEYVSDKSQRIDALVMARFDFRNPREDLSRIPWHDGSPRLEGQIDIPLALELDTGSESSNVLADKFATYRDLHKNGVYMQEFSSDLLLVLMVQNIRRANLLADRFREVWPGGWALISTPSAGGAASSPHGVLWGNYLTLLNEQRVPLLSTMVRDRSRRVIGYQPLMSQEQWIAAIAQQNPEELVITPPAMIPITSEQE